MRTLMIATTIAAALGLAGAASAASPHDLLAGGQSFSQSATPATQTHTRARVSLAGRVPHASAETLMSKGYSPSLAMTRIHVPVVKGSGIHAASKAGGSPAYFYLANHGIGFHEAHRPVL